jgi:hypothetical protein
LSTVWEVGYGLVIFVRINVIEMGQSWLLKGYYLLIPFELQKDIVDRCLDAAKARKNFGETVVSPK